MGCENSQSSVLRLDLKVSIVDSTFMKQQNDSYRKELKDQGVKYEYFVSTQCFFQDFSKKYTNRVVINHENLEQLKTKLSEIDLFPNIYVISEGNKIEQKNDLFKIVSVNSYADIANKLYQNQTSKVITPNQITANQQPKQKINVKIIIKPNSKNSSQQAIFEAALKKSNISYKFFNSFQLLQNSLFQTHSQFVITDYIYHRQVCDLFKHLKTKIICYCAFDQNEVYSPDVYTYSNNCLDIASDLKNQLGEGHKTTVKCSRVYLYNKQLNQEEDICSTLGKFGIQFKTFNNFQKFMHETVYYFCATILCAQSQAKNVVKYLQKNDYLQRVKIISIPQGIEATPKGLFKIARSIKKGYPVKKQTTHSIDIIDKHYNSTKFQEIKKEMDNNNIKCFGYSNLNEYMKDKKFVSPFIICNYEQRLILVKYIKQMQIKSKLIVFCNKNKINQQLLQNQNFAFTSSHFGKILRFIKKTPVFVPVIAKEDQRQFKQKIDKIKQKNKRISALKWSGLDKLQEEADQNEFQFMNIASNAHNGAVREIKKHVAGIWKSNVSILNFEKFKEEFMNSLQDLWKNHKINFEQTHFNQMLGRIKSLNLYKLLQKAKTFFDADNQLGLEMNKSLMKTESLQKQEIANMREFILLILLNYFSGFCIPRIGIKKLSHWMSNSLIQKCEVGSFLFSKHFMIFYEQNSAQIDQISKYKIQIALQNNLLEQSELLLNDFISYKDKIVFSPFSQFQVLQIKGNGMYKTILLKHIKNTNFLKFIYQDNILKQGQNLDDMVYLLQNSGVQLLDDSIREQFSVNVQRIKAIQLFQKGSYIQSIEIHENLIKQIEQKQNLDSILVNQLNFELASFYFKSGMNKQASYKIKQLLESVPSEYLKQKCNYMIKSVIDDTQKKRRISDEAMRAFEDLHNKKQELQQIISVENESDDSEAISEN